MPIRDEIFSGFVSLEKQLSDFKLSDSQLVQYDSTIESVAVDRSDKCPSILDQYKEYQNNHGQRSNLTLRGLLNSDALEFSKTGLISPFEVMDPTHARELFDLSLGQLSLEFENKHFLTDEIQSSLSKAGTWNINFSGLFQALNHDCLRSALTGERIINKLTPLFGDDLLIWRSQFFHKSPNTSGTFWHQTGTFKETSKFAKLTTPEGLDEGSAQLTVWLALSDVTKKTGALRIIPGSFVDNRMEWLFNLMVKNPIEFAQGLDDRQRKRFIKSFYFTPGNFIKSQFIVELAFELWPDYLQGFKVVDLEMRAGEAVIFTSLNMHASYPNTTTDTHRLALAGRFTTPDVKVYSNQEFDYFATPNGNLAFPLKNISCILANGKDHYGWNKLN